MNIGPSVQIAVAGEEALLDWRACAFFPRHDLLVVSDLHLEKGSSFARRGILIPPYDTQATLARLGELIADYVPRIVVCLGDSFHDGGGSGRLSAAMLDAIERLQKGREWYWIAGNHDPAPPVELPGCFATELAAGGVLFRHEPRPDATPGEIAGHLHPGAVARRRGRSVRRRCFACDGNRLVMPAFGAYTGNLNVRGEAFRHLFDPKAFHAYVLGEGTIFPLAVSLLVR